MSRNARIGAVIAAIVVAVAAFVVLQPSDDDDTTTTQQATTQTTTTPATTTTTPATTTTTPATTTTTPTTTTTTTAPKPVPTIRVSGGQPDGGVENITVSKGDRIRFRVTDDTSEHVHLHGYDIEKTVGPGNPASFSLPATITGVFEIEIEETGVQIGKLTVEP
jgi:hypothetical protein